MADYADDEDLVEDDNPLFADFGLDEEEEAEIE